MAENHQLKRLKSNGDLDEPVSAVSGSSSPTRRVSALYDEAAGDFIHGSQPSMVSRGSTMRDTAAAANMAGDSPSSPQPSASRRDSGLRRVPVGSKSPAASPDLNRHSSIWESVDPAEAHAARSMSPAWDNIQSPWAGRPAIAHKYSSVSVGDRAEEPLQVEEPSAPQEVLLEARQDKSTGTKVGFADASSILSSEAGPHLREDQRDIEDGDDEFDNELFYSKYSTYSICDARRGAQC